MSENNTYTSIIIIQRENVRVTIKIERKDVCYYEDEIMTNILTMYRCHCCKPEELPNFIKMKSVQLFEVTLFLFLNIYEKQTLKCNVPKKQKARQLYNDRIVKIKQKNVIRID